VLLLWQNFNSVYAAFNPKSNRIADSLSIVVVLVKLLLDRLFWVCLLSLFVVDGIFGGSFPEEWFVQ